MSGKSSPSEFRRLDAIGRRYFSLALLTFFLAACSFIPRQPFTAHEEAIAQVPGIPGARFWVDGSEAEFRNFMRGTVLVSPGSAPESYDVLALSGGAYDGAFGAGVMGGWTTTGTRPKFAFVTGVSAGALIAPFAFLGPGYDEEMQKAFSEDAAEDLGELGNILTLLGTVDMRHEMLVSLVDRFVDARLLQAVADQHARGRRLLILTTNLDAQRGVVWDMGAIATGGMPYRELFRDILVASASIPGLFGPTYIQVEANGRLFKEMHVDGGATSQVFILPDVAFMNGRRVADPKIRPRVWIVINNHIAPQFEVVQSGLLSTVSRSFSTLIKNDEKSTLLATAAYFGTDHFNLAYIDNAFATWLAANPGIKPGFNAAYMQSLYRFGFEKARSGGLWSSQIPLPGGPGAKRFQEMATH